MFRVALLLAEGGCHVRRDALCLSSGKARCKRHSRHLGKGGYQIIDATTLWTTGDRRGQRGVAVAMFLDEGEEIPGYLVGDRGIPIRYLMSAPHHWPGFSLTQHGRFPILQLTERIQIRKSERPSESASEGHSQGDRTATVQPL